MKKKAFTLAELLIVVLVLGVLAAVATPKMKKVLETRKTTEAENMLTALRTEQEKRCSLGQDYLTDKNQLPVLAQAENSKNYTYQLTGAGAEAVSKAGTYTVKMLSYKNGVLCCDGSGCSSLNKDYPDCNTLTIPTDDECVTKIECSGSGTRSCGCAGKGTQNGTCDHNTGTWQYAACPIADECTCSDDPKPTTTRTCGNCGTQTATLTCNQTTDTWDVTWSACEEPTLQTQACGCNNAGEQTQVCDTDTGTLSWGECSVSEECEVTCENPAFYVGDDSVSADWNRDKLCCENGKMMDYYDDQNNPTEAEEDLLASYCCEDDLYIRCRSTGSGVEFSAPYKNKKTCDTNMGEKFVGYSCSWLPDGGGSDGGGDGSNSEDIPTCSRPGTHTTETSHGNSCGMTKANSCTDFHSEIHEENCTCTVNWVEEIGDRSMNGPTCNYRVNYTLS